MKETEVVEDIVESVEETADAQVDEVEGAEETETAEESK